MYLHDNTFRGGLDNLFAGIGQGFTGNRDQQNQNPSAGDTTAPRTPSTGEMFGQILGTAGSRWLDSVLPQQPQPNVNIQGQIPVHTTGPSQAPPVFNPYYVPPQTDTQRASIIAEAEAKKTAAIATAAALGVGLLLLQRK